MNIQAKLKLLRHGRGYKQQDVARLLGISVPAYSKIENGLTDLNYSRLEQLACLYQLSAVQLLDPHHDPLKKDDAALAASLRARLLEREQQLAQMLGRMASLQGQLGLLAGKKTA